MPRSRTRVRDAVGRAVEHPARRRGVVDAEQLVVVTLVRRRARRVPGVGAGVGEVVHAGVVERARLVLMVEAPRVTDLLADDMLLLVGIVVGRRVEVRVVDLHGPLADVRSGDPDRREPEPAVVAVRAVADLDAARCRTALALRRAGHDRVVCDGRLVPVRRRLCQTVLPVRGRHVVSDLDRERVRRSRPVIRAPRMAGERGRRRRSYDKRGQPHQNDDSLHSAPLEKMPEIKTNHPTGAQVCQWARKCARSAFFSTAAA